VDHRVIEQLVDVELSIGDYILTNGAIAAVIVIDAVARLIPGALGDERSPVDESFANGLLEAPAYTKPNVFRNLAVPDILLSGNHPAIEAWKQKQAIARTKKNRPDLYEKWRRDNGQ
jgi:tRNA (guanine37-N1)-methyltransferase